MQLEIIGAGFGRTGTNSTKHALEQLGFGPCHHMYEIRANPDLLPAWTAVADGAPPDWDDLFAGFRAQVDWPGAAYWRELAAYFPKAKVILNVRDPAAWFDSMQHTITPSLAGHGTYSEPLENGIATLGYKLVTRGVFEDRLDDRDYAIARFIKHIEDVRSEIPAERLLVFDTNDGWEPLCTFLGVKIPECEFPSTNSAKEFNDKRR